MKAATASVSVALVAALLLPSSLAVAQAGERKCLGRTATIVVRGRGHHKVRGTNGPDVILVERGSATIRARSGGDRICGGTRGDRIYGGGGVDRVASGRGHDVVRVGAGDDLVRAGRGRDVVRGGAGWDRIRGGRGKDSLNGGARADWVLGGAGSDVIRLGDGTFDSVRGQLAYGGSGDDVVYGSGLHESIHGDDGDDVIFGRATDWSEGGGGPDYLYGGEGTDRIVSGREDGAPDGRSSFSFGGEGDDVLQDLDGSGVLAGGPGDDVLEGTDRHTCCTELDFDAAPAGVTVDLVEGTATGEGSDVIAGNVYRINGSAFDDTLIGTDLENFLSGNGGDDALHGGGGADGFSGGAGDDRIDGGAGVDVLHARSPTGDLDIDLTAGVATGDGTDSLGGLENVFAGNGASGSVVGDAGPNRIEWYGSLTAGAGFRIDGRAGDDVVSTFGEGSVDGGAGDDFLGAGGMRNGSLAGSDGNDLLEFHYLLPGGRDEPVAVDGGDGTDTIRFRQSFYPVDVDLAAGVAYYPQTAYESYALASVEDVVGSFVADVLRGDDGPNRLHGGRGDDVIEGRDGDDYVDGGEDEDALDGGPGRDECVNGETVRRCEV